MMVTSRLQCCEMWRWILYSRGGREGEVESEGKSVGFIPEKKKSVIYTREKLQKQGFSSSYHIPCVPIGLVGIVLYLSFPIGYRGRVSVLPYNHN